ncbi:hypothetical protein BGX24_008999 [Mortierella sp. AD032]|nr:hypothetical protein BGX24_008999 [Mortierella sp. AD032]
MLHYNCHFVGRSSLGFHSLASSRLTCRFLEPPYITQNDGPSTAVFDEEDHIIKLLVNDCDSHGRALKGLQEVLRRYSEAVLAHSPTAHDIARTILTRTFLVPNAPVPGTFSLPGEIAIPGLIRYEQPSGLGAGGYLIAPYIWVWLFSYQPKKGADPILNNWSFCDYSALKSKMDPRSPPGAQFWQNFEHFAATFRCLLKSRMLDEGEPTTISAIHAGARLNGNISFINHHLKLDLSSHQVDTKSTTYRHHSTLRCENDEVDIRNGEHCIINARSAPLVTVSSDWMHNRCAQKSTSFGPYASRAFVFATAGALDINLAQRKHLKGVEGADDRKPDFIIQERTKRKFDSYEDVTQRLCGVGAAVLKRFEFPRSA